MSEGPNEPAPPPPIFPEVNQVEDPGAIQRAYVALLMQNGLRDVGAAAAGTPIQPMDPSAALGYAMAPGFQSAPRGGDMFAAQPSAAVAGGMGLIAGEGGQLGGAPPPAGVQQAADINEQVLQYLEAMKLIPPRGRAAVGYGEKVGVKYGAPGQPGGDAALGRQDPMAGISTAAQAKANALAAEGQALAEGKLAEQRIRDSVNLRYEGQLQREEQFRAKMQQVADAQGAQLDADLQTWGSMRPSPGKVLRDSSAVGKFLRGLGALAAGLGTRATGGENRALTIIRQEIDDDIAAQRDAINAKGQSIQQRMGLYRVNLDRWGNEAQAMAATRAAYLQLGQQQLEAEMAGKEAPAVVAKYRGAIADLQMGVAQEKAKFIEAARQRGVQYAQMNQGERHFQQQLKLEAAKADAMGHANKAKMMTELSGRTVSAVTARTDGRKIPIARGDDKDAINLNEFSQQVQTARHLLRDIEDIERRMSMGDKVLPWKEGYQLKQEKVALLHQAMNKINQNGVMNAGDQESLNKSTGPAINLIDNYERRQALYGDLQRIAQNKFQQRVITYDPDTQNFSRGGDVSWEDPGRPVDQLAEALRRKGVAPEVIERIIQDGNRDERQGYPARSTPRAPPASAFYFPWTTD